MSTGSDESIFALYIVTYSLYRQISCALSPWSGRSYSFITQTLCVSTYSLQPHIHMRLLTFSILRKSLSLYISYTIFTGFFPVLILHTLFISVKSSFRSHQVDTTYVFFPRVGIEAFTGKGGMVLSPFRQLSTCWFSTDICILCWQTGQVTNSGSIAETRVVIPSDVSSRPVLFTTYLLFSPLSFLIEPTFERKRKVPPKNLGLVRFGCLVGLSGVICPVPLDQGSFSYNTAQQTLVHCDHTCPLFLFTLIVSRHESHYPYRSCCVDSNRG